MNAAVAGARRDTACSLAWGTKLAAQTDPATAAGVLGGATDGLSDRERALAGGRRRVARDPNATAEADVDELRAAGLDEREIAEATMLAVFRLAFTAYNAALGVPTDAGAHRRRAGRGAPGGDLWTRVRGVLERRLVAAPAGELEPEVLVVDVQRARRSTSRPERSWPGMMQVTGLCSG